MNITKSSLIVLMSISATNTYAAINANPGFYLGGAVSAANSSTPPGSSLGGILDSVAHVSLRPTIGYRFNDYFALEGGFLSAADSSDAPNGIFGRDELKIYSFDAAVKGIMPFESGFSLFAKAGLAYTHQYVYNQMFVSDATPVVDKATNHIQPLIGAGVSYNFNKNLASELSYSYYMPSGNIGKIGMIELGLTYTFGGDA